MVGGGSYWGVSTIAMLRLLLWENEVSELKWIEWSIFGAVICIGRFTKMPHKIPPPPNEGRVILLEIGKDVDMTVVFYFFVFLNFYTALIFFTSEKYAALMSLLFLTFINLLFHRKIHFLWFWFFV